MINRDKLSDALEHLAALFDDTIYRYHVSDAVEVEPGVAQVVLNISVKTEATVNDYISRELNVKVKEFDAQIDTMLEKHLLIDFNTQTMKMGAAVIFLKPIAVDSEIVFNDKDVIDLHSGTAVADDDIDEISDELYDEINAIQDIKEYPFMLTNEYLTTSHTVRLNAGY